jgi:phosphoglycolate phosphatase-like HAD superfamily hydrolase
MTNDGTLTRALTKENSTSKVEKFNLILRELNFEIENTYFVTDTIGDLLEAKELKIKTFCVTWGIHKKEDFLIYNPYQIINKPEQLLSHFK